MNILTIGAHPDDIEFGCAPVLIKETRKGNQVRLLVLSRGEAGSSGTPESREQESRNAARMIGAAAIDFLDFGGDCHMQYAPSNSLRIATEIRKFKPAIVLAPHPDENQHPDHSVAGRMSRDACRLARYGGIEELKSLPVHKVASLYFYHITRHLDAPDIVIDVSDERAAWELAMNCHESQIKSKSYVDLQITAARLLGLTIGVEYAIGLFANDPIRLESLSDVILSSRNF